MPGDTHMTVSGGKPRASRALAAVRFLCGSGADASSGKCFRDGGGETISSAL